MKILFCGAGALGSHALMIARDIDHELAVIDFDRVETKNLGSQWFVKQMVGKNKATAIKMQMLNFHGVRTKDFIVKLEAGNAVAILGQHDLIIDCFDNAASRRLIQSFTRRHGVPSIHAGLAADGEFGTVRWDRDFAIDAEDVPGQPTCDGTGFLPIIVTVAGSLVTSVRRFIENGECLNWNISPTRAESFVTSPVAL